MRLRVATLSLLNGLAGCDLTGVYYIFVHVPGYADGTADMPVAYQLGDTVTFEATEHYAEGSRGSPAGPSLSAPKQYEWDSTDESVAQVIGSGRVRMRTLGRASVGVRTGHAYTSIDVVVVPRVAGVRITPSAVTLNVGDTVSFAITALDSLGRVVPQIGRLTNTVSLRNSDYPDSWSNPISANVVTDDMTRFLYRGFRAGTVTVIASLPIDRASALRATASIDVR